MYYIFCKFQFKNMHFAKLFDQNPSQKKYYLQTRSIYFRKKHYLQTTWISENLLSEGASKKMQKFAYR